MINALFATRLNIKPKIVENRSQYRNHWKIKSKTSCKRIQTYKMM